MVEVSPPPQKKKKKMLKSQFFYKFEKRIYKDFELH